jgi:hypothetical protein
MGDSIDFFVTPVDLPLKSCIIDTNWNGDGHGCRDQCDTIVLNLCKQPGDMQVLDCCEATNE